KKIVDRAIPGHTQVILANAIYLKGNWTRKFDPKQTRERPFNLIGGGTSMVRMMEQSGRFGYQQGEDFQAVRLPYGEDRLAMCVLLPGSKSSLEKLLSGLDGAAWE